MKNKAMIRGFIYVITCVAFFVLVLLYANTIRYYSELQEIRIVQDQLIVIQEDLIQAQNQKISKLVNEREKNKAQDEVVKEMYQELQRRGLIK